MHCTRCGHQNPEGSRFCAQCGAALSQERVGEATSVIPKVGGEDSGEAPGLLRDPEQNQFPDFICTADYIRDGEDGPAYCRRVLGSPPPKIAAE